MSRMMALFWLLANFVLVRLWVRMFVELVTGRVKETWPFNAGRRWISPSWQPPLYVKMPWEFCAAILCVGVTRIMLPALHVELTWSPLLFTVLLFVTLTLFQIPAATAKRNPAWNLFTIAGLLVGGYVFV
jgi:hypothetical protein